MLISPNHFMHLVCLECGNSVTQINSVATRVRDERNSEHTNLAAASERAWKGNVVCILAVP